MKITSVKPWLVKVGSEGWGEYLFIEVNTDDGVTGWGEITTTTRAANRALAAMVQQLNAEIVGEDPSHIERLWHKVFRAFTYMGSRGAACEAISGVDIALWDIFGKAVGLPIYQLLGGAFRDRIKAYASGVPGATSEQQVANAVKFVVEQGFTTVKMSIGRKDLDTEMKAVAAVSRAISDRAHLLVDAHGAYDAYTAIALGREMQALGVYWLEDPLPPEDHSGYKMLSDALDMAIAAGETECNRYQFRDRLADRAVDILLPDVCRAGGISECRKIAQLADAYNTPWAAHVSMGSPIHIAASLHLGAASPNFLICECPTHQNPIGNNLLKSPLACEDGFFTLPDGPGLGIELDEGALAQVILEEQ